MDCDGRKLLGGLRLPHLHTTANFIIRGNSCGKQHVKALTSVVDGGW